MEPSSPTAPAPTLPPSSDPSGYGVEATIPRRTGDALTLDEADAQEADDTQDGASARKRRRPKVQANGDVPLVKDAIGESLADSFEAFLRTYTAEVELPATPAASDDGINTQTDETFPYIEQIHTMREFGLTTLYVKFKDILEVDEVLADAIQTHYYRFLPYLRRAIYNLIAEYEPEYLKINPTSAAADSANLQSREFSIAFYDISLTEGIRQLKTEKIGRLTSISGTVTRTSEVRPELLYGSFICEVCNGLVHDIEQQFKYTEPSLCPNALCGNRTAWQLQIDTSKFTDWQKVRIQENPSDIPTGSMPRSLDVILRGEMVERAKAGDKCTFTGTFIVVPDVSQLGLPGGNRAELQREVSKGAGAAAGAGGNGVTGLKSLGVRDLQYKTAFLACMVTASDAREGTNIRGEEVSEESTGQAFIDSLTNAEYEELEAMIDSENIYSRLVASIAPTVYGHEIVKKGLLLQLMGGVHKQTPEGMHLRGDINICIVGDPSTSKSQFLKYICSFLPRAVYTSGKASSAAGLTAAVVKDEETGDFTIEAGALMLADNGICAIDEFDKMDLSDQVAIHEAMEQQTISIAKAGIHATLNARTSILAAANPIGGRYDRKKSLRANLAMSAPIMSRFDLFFVVLDECDEKVDYNIAKHIVNIHKLQDDAIEPEFSTETLQRFIRYARTFQPKMTREAADLLVEKYRTLRQDDATGAGRNSYRITVRQLESMIRLSEAIARANCSSEIHPSMVREAYSLLRQSIIHVEQDDIDFDEEELQGERSELPSQSGEGEDVAMAEDTQDDENLPVRLRQATAQHPVASSETGAVPEPAQAQPTSVKKHMKITHDQYIQLQSMITLKIGQHEESQGKGIDKEDLIDWYLLEMEEAGQLPDEEQLAYHNELIRKVLRKLVKDSHLLELKGDVHQSLPDAPASTSSTGEEENVRSYFMLHPGFDTEGSSLASGF